MAAVNFDRQFVYIGTGWEGSAADMRILRCACERGGFTVPDGKYYLVDSGYANTQKFISPYRGLKYHLGEFGPKAHRNYTGPEEMFNHRHAQLRNTVERTFGIWKKRFPILKNMKSFSFDVQVDIVMACAIIHNYIAQFHLTDAYLHVDVDSEEEACGITQSVDDNLFEEMISVGDSNKGALLRTQIKNEMWLMRVTTLNL
ncbi:hypothetical protein AXF42_Ash014688 [Apostasia shenzhenica]|uniref:DDE Tnp4 domain-containing protein n=1 Tax=Apostasia shenzhenica TaxID=1088818 RepID=A0A2I0AKN7_9ASPA|nr:hypothetical protein AXF42_Ash014688 [Apostasia shenzhenica]